MSLQQQAHQAFCSLIKESKSGSLYLLMRLSDLLYTKHGVSIYLKDSWSLQSLSDEHASLVLQLIPELEDGHGGISEQIQDALGL